MMTTTMSPWTAPATAAPARTADFSEVRSRLRTAFGVEFAIWDAATGNLLAAASDEPAGDEALISGLVRGTEFSTEPVFLADEDWVLLLAVPLAAIGHPDCVATAFFAANRPTDAADLEAIARSLLCDPAVAERWLARQSVWTPDALLRLSHAVLAHQRAQRHARRLQAEVESVSAQLAATYEEISLLYAVTQSLNISRSDEELGTLTLDRLQECLPACCLAICFLPVASESEVTYKARTTTALQRIGKCDVSDDDLKQLVATLDFSQEQPFVANERITALPDWACPAVRQLVVVPLRENNKVFGWLAALNHRDGAEFGTEEANLLHSVASIIGVHAGNRELYRQQAEFLADVVEAFTSAIDAKDPYTCGHSDRVARIAVRLAKELDCPRELLHTIYMAGLLHDIGKIGINDAVLSKPGRLTEAEFEHIKLHPELGYKILADLKQLHDVLPAVLHHHEQWNGQGYPQRLAGDAIPWIARIMAVADAYDAMTSDRPYRRGMPESQVAEIFRQGAGRQWDPAVIDAYFASQTDIRDICRKERARLSLDVEQWT